MRLIFYLFLIIQLLNFLGVFAEKVREDSSGLNPVRWEKVKEKSSINLEANIIWEPYQDDEIFPGENRSKNILNNQEVNTKFSNKDEKDRELLQIEPHIPLNNYLNSGDFILSSYWKSAFDGGAGGGTGNQNISAQFDYGLSDFSLFSIYLSETDDPLYNSIQGEVIPNYWGSVAIGFKKRIFESFNRMNSISIAGSLEYWNISSGSDSPNSKKSIYNEIDNSVGHDNHDKFIYSLSFPFSKELNKKTKILIVPGAIFIPDKLGDKNIGKNFYGNNYFFASGLDFDVADNIQLVGSYTYLFGPGHNSFDKNLKYHRNSIYSYGINWDVNQIISFEGKITNGYGSTPTTSLLTIPSDNKPIYYLGGKYKPFSEDTKFNPLEEKNESLLFGGVTNNNALFPEKGGSQISINYDDKGNQFAFYGYSLSNIFQLEIINIGSFNNLNLSGIKNSNLYSTYLSENDLNYRLGGKLLIYSPQKNDLYWLALRTSLGRNDDTKQGYLFTELINTFRVNNWLAFNISPKYFFSGVESFGGIGFSGYINLSDNLMLIPEMNSTLKKDSNLNSTLALRYSFSPAKSLDLYYSNAAGVQDIGQLLKDNEYRFGIKLNFLY